MTHPTCKTCGHWQPARWGRLGDALYGALSGWCHKHGHWGDEGHHVTKATQEASHCIIGFSNQGRERAMRTGPDFYCPHHTALTVEGEAI